MQHGIKHGTLKIFENNPHLIQCTVVLCSSLLSIGVTSWCCGSGHKYYFILGTVWASAELPACSCLLFHRDGRKRWAERYTGGGDKVVEGRGKWGQAGRRTQMAGRELKKQRRGTRSKSAVVQRSGGPPPWPSCREEGWAVSERWLQARPALLPSPGSPLGLPCPGWPSLSCSSCICNLLLHMQQTGNSSSTLWLFTLQKRLAKTSLKMN